VVSRIKLLLPSGQLLQFDRLYEHNLWVLLEHYTVLYDLLKVNLILLTQHPRQKNYCYLTSIRILDIHHKKLT